MKAATSPNQAQSALSSSSRAGCSCARKNECAVVRRQPGDKTSCALPSVAKESSEGRSDDERFHLNCVVAQVWLVQLRRYTEVRYEGFSGARRPMLQSGYAWRSFSTLFAPPNALEAVRLFENLLRFANYENESAAPARTFFLAYAPLVFEHDLSGEYIGQGVWSPETGSQNAAARVRRTLKRGCDWLEALIHFQIHERHSRIARELDEAIIFLWPLLNRHRWSALDLLTVLRSLLNCRAIFPCQSAEQLMAYCRSALGLRVPHRKTAVKRGKLPGLPIAERLFRFLPTID